MPGTKTSKPGWGIGSSSLLERIAAIIEHPDLYGSKSTGFRETIVSRTFPFVIVYRIYRKEKVVYISSIYHQKRNPGRKYRK